MDELKRFLKDPRFLIPVGFLLGFELFLQSGLYKNFLQPKSYADNVNHVVRVNQRSRVDPDVLILGTSVPYQGINLPKLNRLIGEEHLTAQSGATEGAMLITQHSIFRAIAPRYKHLKVVLHVCEATFPWTARYDLDPANRSMVAQFPRRDAIPLLQSYGYRLTREDWSFFLVRSLTYQKDLRDFTMSPLSRIKRLGRRWREGYSDYPYENQYQYSLAAYPARSLQECVDIASKGIPEFDSRGVRITDSHHREAVLKTCQLGMWDPAWSPGAYQWSELFFRQLEIFYKDIESRGMTVVTLFPPYSSLINDMNSNRRMQIWNDHLKRIHGNHPYYAIDMRDSLNGPDNLSLYYDTIHLNRKGSLLFTDKVADELKKIAPEIRSLEDANR